MKSRRGRKNDIFRLHLTISIVFVAHILVLIGASGREKEQPTHLTPMNPKHPIVLPYVREDQCMLGPGQKNIGSFGLLFRLPHGFLCPNKGLVICYPSQLDPQKTTNGMAAAILYKVGNSNDPKQEIVEKCCQGQKVCTMHGIRVSTNETRKNIVVELSITTDNYTLPLVDQFWIEFGREENLVTVIRTPDINGKKNRRPVRFPLNFALYKAYMDNVGRGAMLGKYAGLWMLGVDLLPTEAENEVQFVIHRDCECTMQAWFTRPTDEEDPGQFSTIEIGSNVCNPDDATVKDKTYNDIGSLETNTMITVWLMPKASTQSVEISLYAEGKMILSLTIEKQRITYNEKNWDHGAIEISNRDLLQPGKEVRVEIHMHEHSYEAVYVEGNEIIENNYWPDLEMAKKLEQCQIRVKTNAYIGRVEKLARAHEEWAPPKWPFSMRLKHYVTHGTILRIHGEVHADAKFLEINLMHDAPEWHEYIGATPLQIHVNFEDNSILMQTYHNGKWLGNETFKEDVNGFKNPFEKGKMFNLVIMMQRDNMTTLYTITVNTIYMHFKGDLPVWTINWLWLKGDMNLLTLPIEEYQLKTEENIAVMKYELEHLFFEEEELCIVGKPDLIKNNASTFQVYLFHEANEEDPNIGDTLMKIDFTFFAGGNGDKLFVESKLHHLISGQQLPPEEAKNPIGNAGQIFTLVIKPMMNQYAILVNEGLAMEYLDESNSDMPPSWIVNWITVTGDVGNIKIGKQSERCENKGQKPLPIYIKQVDPYKLLDIGNVITIQGIIKKGNDKSGEELHISIGFFREALEWHPIIGQTVLMANFSSQAVEFDTYYNKTWKYKENLGNAQKHTLAAPLEEGHQFSMKVEVKEKEYEIHIGSDIFTYSHKWMPYWAVQYIVVKGDLEGPADNLPSFIQID